MTPSPSGAWIEMDGGVRVRQSVLFRMNSVLLAHPEHSVLVDPGVLPSELDDLARAVRARDSSELTLIFTHGDWDHVLGRPWWPEASSVAHDRFAGEIRHKREAILSAASAAVAGAGERWDRGFEPFRPRVEVSGLHFDRLGPWRLVYRDAFGHSRSMLSVHLPEHRLLIAADMLSDIEIPLLLEPCRVYRRTLLELLPLAENGAIRTLIPGHGSIANRPEEVLERLRRDLTYLDELERGVLAARAGGLSLEQTTERLQAMDYVSKRADYSMVENHRDNVAVEYEATPAITPITDRGP